MRSFARGYYEGVYDHVNWDFLILVLIKIGLGDRWGGFDR